jgi:hypothetical protein
MSVSRTLSRLLGLTTLVLSGVPVAACGQADSGIRSRTGHGAAVGGLALGATGLLLALVGSSDQNSFYEIGPGEVIGVTAVFAAVGAGVGALIGSASHTDRWEPVELSSPYQPQAARPRRGLLGLALRF